MAIAVIAVLSIGQAAARICGTRAPRGGLLVTTPPVNLRLELRARRRGVDVVVDEDDVRELARRIPPFLINSHPAY